MSTAMSDGLGEFHDELRTVARGVFAAGGPLGTADWAQVVQAGFTGLEIAEACDGAGAAFAETAVVLEELGRAAVRTPLLGAVLATVVAEGNADLQRAIAGGVTVAVAHEGFTVSNGRVTGRCEFVIDAPEAATVVVVDGDVVAALSVGGAGTAGLSVESQPVLDETRSLGVVTATDVVADAVWEVPNAAQLVADRGALAIAIDSLGLSEAMTTATVEYATVREQFGRPIGSFQAVKHACADMAVHNTVARSLVTSAISTQQTAAISMAKAYATAAASFFKT